MARLLTKVSLDDVLTHYRNGFGDGATCTRITMVYHGEQGGQPMACLDCSTVEVLDISDGDMDNVLPPHA
jgi:hypothetical protein